MKQSTGSQNCGQYSNISTKRSGNISRESTCRVRTVFSNQSSCFSSPKNMNSKITLLRNNSSYSKIHLNTRNSIEQQSKPLGEDQNITEVMVSSSIKIQRFWRFHMLMRRKAHSKIIHNLQQDTKIWLLTLRNSQTQNQILQRRISAFEKQTQEQSSNQLTETKELMKQFTQSSIKKQITMMNTISRVRKEIQYYNNTSATLKQSIQQHESAIKKLLKKQQYFKQRQESHIGNINRLNKDLILLNMEKSRIQLQVDQLRCELREQDIS